MELPTRPFRIEYLDEPSRVVRGRVTLPVEHSEPVPWVMVLHGFKGFMDWGFFPELARRLAGSGVASVAFNTSGSGVGEDLETFDELDAFARDTLSRQLEDIERVLHLVRGGTFPELAVERAGLFGHSRGGGAALVHAAETGAYRALVTWASVADADRFDDDTKALWREQGWIPILNARTGQELRMDLAYLEDVEASRERFDLERIASGLDLPALLFHGTADEAVDVEALGRLARALPRATARAVEGAGHTFGARHPLGEIPLELGGVLDSTVDWLAERLGATPELGAQPDRARHR